MLVYTAFFIQPRRRVFMMASSNSGKKLSLSSDCHSSGLRYNNRRSENRLLLAVVICALDGQPL